MSATIVDHPDDILIAILSRCDACSILSLRKTCLRLEEISYTRVVWLNAFKLFCQTYPHLTPNLERTLSSHGSEDLEIVVTRLFSLQDNFTRPDPSPTKISEASIVIDDQDVRVMPTPGGRWLLVLRDQMRSIKCYDLDNLSLPPKVLSTTEDDRILSQYLTSCTNTCFAYHGRERMTFGMSLISSQADTQLGGHSVRKCYFWDLETEGSQHAGARLAVVRRSSFDIPYHTESPPCVNEYGLAQVGSGFVDVFRWRPRERTCVSLRDRVEGVRDVRLLSQDQILVYGKNLLEIYTLPTFSSFDESNSFANIVPLPPVRKITLNSDPEFNFTLTDSTLRHTHLSSWIRDVLVILESPLPNRQVVEYSSASRPDGAYSLFSTIGHHRGVRLIRHGGTVFVQLLSYHKCPQSGEWVATEREFQWANVLKPHPESMSWFDEQSGRLLGVERIGRSFHKIVLMDFA